MIRHIVLIRFRAEISRQQRDALFAELGGLKTMIPGTLDFFAGPNVSPETPVLHGFMDGFWFDFKNAKARDAYLVDERHKAIGAKLVAAAEGGLAGVQVFDVEV
jgi:Stress responsive A/B Barrel Domain